MAIVILSIVAFLVAILTFFSGFGLGTILTPVFLIYFPADVAIALTAIVHFSNNLFKLVLVGKHADKMILIRFGIPAVLAAFLGSWLLLKLTGLEPLFSYNTFGKTVDVDGVKFIVSVILIVFVSIEFIPYFGKLQFNRNKRPLGGAFSGFFGGLSGNQGAMRSAFLIKAVLSKEAFLGTTVVVSTFVDFTRLGIYSTRISQLNLSENLALILAATVSAIIGSIVGNKLLKKVTLKSVQSLVAVMLICTAIALGSGLI